MTKTAEVVLSPVPRGPEVISGPEWLSLCTQGPNVLLQGSEEATESVVLLLEPYLRRPVRWIPGQTRFSLPGGECGALVVRNAASLSRKEQDDLLRWLDHGEVKQVVSTNVEPLFPLVGRGLFDERLYYRLNVVLLSLDPATHGSAKSGNVWAARQAASEHPSHPQQEPHG